MRRGFSILGEAIKREPRVFTVALIGSVLFGGLTVADAWVLGWATENALMPALRDGEIGPGVLVAVGALFIGVAIVRAVGIVGRRVGAGIMQFRMQQHDRRDVTRQYLALPVAWHERHPTGQLLSNANSDVEAAWRPIAPLPMAIGTAAMMVIAIFQMLFADVVLGLVGLLIFPIVIVVNIFYQRRQSPLMTRAQQYRAELSEVAHESFDGGLVVKTLGREAEETARFERKAEQLRDVLVRAGRVRAVFDPTLAAIPNLGVLLVLAVGVSRVLNGDTTSGDVVTVAYLLTVVAFPIRSIGWMLGEFPGSVVGHGRIRNVLRADGHMEYGPQRASASGAVALRLDNVGFAYPDAAPVLGSVTFDVRPGATVAVVGPTAAGKSTLMSLLARLVDPDHGRVSLDGVVAHELDADSLATRIALVPQIAFLFDDTVRGNVSLGDDFTDDEVWAALDTAQAAGFVRALSAGLDTKLGERGTSLSGGQRQRISLARALVRRPGLLLLDDATSAVDPDVEQRILAGIRSDRGATTTVMVAYRKASIDLADSVVYLDEGRVMAQGPHHELLDTQPGYANLVNAYEHPVVAVRGDHDE